MGLLDFKPECPKCHNKLDGYTKVEGGLKPPQDGDFTVCLYCQSVLQMQNKAFLELSDERVTELSNEDLRFGKGILVAKAIAKMIMANKQKLQN